MRFAAAASGLRGHSRRVVSAAVSTRPVTASALGRALAVACVLCASIAFSSCQREAVPAGDRIVPRLSEILNGSDPLQRVTQLSELLTQLGPDAVPAVVEAFEKAPLDGVDPELVLFGMWWAR